MLLNQLRYIKFKVSFSFTSNQQRWYNVEKPRLQNIKPQDAIQKETRTIDAPASNEHLLGEIFPAARIVPMVLTNKEPVVLSFDEVPGPKSLKYISKVRSYMSEIGTQLTASILTFGLNIGAYINNRKPLRNLSILFDEYGPVVRFVSPVGGDIVLINHPDHIQKVYMMEGDCPVRSTLDSLEKYRTEHRNRVYAGLYTVHGQEWMRQRTVVYNPLHSSVTQHIQGIDDVCENFVQKVYNLRNNQDEIPKDLYKELHKWSFDCMGLILFSKKFTMLNTELVYSQCDMSWLYHSLEKATQAIIKCETGLHFWKLFTTPAWHSLVKYCDSLDNLIGKHVMEAEQAISFKTQDEIGKNSLINAMLMSDAKMNAEDIATIIMDMLLIGVNTITSSMSFMLYYLAKYQRSQKILYEEISKSYRSDGSIEIDNIKEETPYLQACIKETLRLVPPIPVLTRILSKNVTLDRYNIPRGTLIIMSTQDASLKENNYDDATKFCPDRWLKTDAKDYHAFASIPFGFGARKCIGQNIAETMLSMLTIRLIQKYKLEYHYGDIEPTRSFIAKPNKPLKIRFVDRI
ncbi:probable cytochrome P450 301a1, mitochondrial [Galleria mellonella]|uniref:Probable cytochrome P450 301a1, mitochondrial n=1 Tax=Galleria mellonella TaxID=7137 RepID=A0A6J1WM34_GALME|nr:probable cytochrome P450 301a1, mitochondrial [Galleria mellonella]